MLAPLPFVVLQKTTGTHVCGRRSLFSRFVALTWSTAIGLVSTHPSTAVAITEATKSQPTRRASPTTVPAVADCPVVASGSASTLQIPIEAQVILTHIRSDGRRTGELQVHADLEEALRQMKPGEQTNLRIAITIGQPPTSSSTVESESIIVGEKPNSGRVPWAHTTMVTWAPQARCLTLLLQNQTTNASGVATLELPSPEPALMPAIPPGVLPSTAKGPLLPVDVTLQHGRRRAGSLTATLRVVIDADMIVESLAKFRQARLQLRVIAESPAGRTTILSLERSIPFDITVDQWVLESPITISANSTRLFVAVVETRTGAHGVRLIDPAALE